MKTNGTDKKKLIAAIATLILALLGGGGYYAGNQNDDTGSEGTSQLQSEYEQESRQSQSEVQDAEEQQYYFRSQSLLESHYEKHGKDMGFASAREYEAAASKVVSHPDVLHKTEAEDGDDVYYIEATNEFVVVSGDGYIRTYFYPSDGIDYYNRQ